MSADDEASIPKDIQDYVLPCNDVTIDEPFVDQDPDGYPLDLFPEFLKRVLTEYKPNPLFRKDPDTFRKNVVRLERLRERQFSGWDPAMLQTEPLPELPPAYECPDGKKRRVTFGQIPDHYIDSGDDEKENSPPVDYQPFSQWGSPSQR